MSSDGNNAIPAAGNGALLFEAAMWYADLGWCIIPIRHKSESGKEPACQSIRPYQTKQPSTSKLRRWFRRTDLHGLAVMLGPVSGNLVCRDFDDSESYDRWALEHLHLAETLPTVQTARAAHVYCTADIGMIADRLGTKCYTDLGDSELRFNGVYCLLPPSIHPTGVLYEWLVPLMNGNLLHLDPFAAGLGERLTEPSEPTEPTHAIVEVVENDSALAEAIEHAIASTLPTGHGQRDDLQMPFARSLMAIPTLAGADLENLRPIAREWHRRALPNVKTKPWEETWIAFVRAWKRAILPKGADLMLILERADAGPMPAVAEEYEQEGVKRLVAFCRELQRAAGESAFYLSCRNAGRLLGVDHDTAARWLRLLVVDRILTIAKKGTRYKATRYRYIAAD